MDLDAGPSEFSIKLRPAVWRKLLPRLALARVLAAAAILVRRILGDPVGATVQAALIVDAITAAFKSVTASIDKTYEALVSAVN